MTELQLRPIPRIRTSTPQEFRDRYLEPLRPVIITELAASWPALKKWSPEFFKETYGEKRVRLYNAGFAIPGKAYMSNVDTLSLKDYLDVVMTNTADLRMFLYNIKGEIPELVDDIRFPDIASGFSKNFIFMFFGCQGSVAQMHFDIDMGHVFHTPIRGAKTVTLFPYEQATNLYRHPFTCRSYVDVHHPDFNKFPQLLHAKGYRDVLRPGETLFMPSGYWHHIVYDEPGYAVSLRCRHQSPAARLRGYYNLFLMSPIDRVMNKVAPEPWFRWKERSAGKDISNFP